MEIICCRTYDELSGFAADCVEELLKAKPDAAIGLPTGQTPLGMYKKLIDSCAKKKISFSKARLFTMDEYDGLSAADAQSCGRYMHENLFDSIDIPQDGIDLLRGDADDELECERYTSVLNSIDGGLDMQILGIGSNGHFGCNEPSEAFYPDTHKVLLSDETVASNARLFADPSDSPSMALTVGVRPIMRAKKVLLLAYGSGKAVALAKAVNGSITPFLPASILQLCDNVTVIADEAALSLL